MKQNVCDCPKCGEDINTQCEDIEYDLLGDLIYRKMYCRKCEHTWREYFKITYDGYSDESGIYNADGEKEGN